MLPFAGCTIEYAQPDRREHRRVSGTGCPLWPLIHRQRMFIRSFIPKQFSPQFLVLQLGCHGCCTIRASANA